MTIDHPQDQWGGLTERQWLRLPLKLRNRYREETKFNTEPAGEELKQAIGRALAALAAEQARLNRPDGWRAAHAAERALQEEADRKCRIEDCDPVRAAHIDMLLARQLQRSIARNGRMVEALRCIRDTAGEAAAQLAREALDEGSGCKAETETAK